MHSNTQLETVGLWSSLPFSCYMLFGLSYISSIWIYWSCSYFWFSSPELLNLSLIYSFQLGGFKNIVQEHLCTYQFTGTWSCSGNQNNNVWLLLYVYWPLNEWLKNPNQNTLTTSTKTSQTKIMNKIPTTSWQ